jgi:hypothetical protein
MRFQIEKSRFSFSQESEMNDEGRQNGVLHNIGLGSRDEISGIHVPTPSQLVRHIENETLVCDSRTDGKTVEISHSPL